jgi:2-polyprenyl-6-methoxyphenol hydroxylase-like FAD-dependent oxidoreductase
MTVQSEVPKPGERCAVVVGGGIGGLAAARALQLSGWSVQVLEQAERLEPLGAGISLWPNAVVALDALGVPLRHGRADGRVLGGRGVVAAGVRSSGGRWLSRTDISTYPARHGAPLVALHRGDLQQLLLDSLRPDTLVTGAHVHGVDEQSFEVVVRHSLGAIRADLVVLADGLASRHRALVTGPLPRSRYAGYTAWRGITDVAEVGPEIEGATESLGAGQRFGMVPLADGRTYWFGTANVEQGQRAPDGEHDEVLRRFGSWHQPVRDVVEATDPAAVLRHDVYDLRPDPATYTRGRLVLLGDAAHAMTPNLGQGACQALEDAVTLGVLTHPGADLLQALKTYDGLRRPRAQLVARRARQIGRFLQLSGRSTAAARSLLLQGTPAWVADRSLAPILSWQPPTA